MRLSRLIPILLVCLHLAPSLFSAELEGNPELEGILISRRILMQRPDGNQSMTGTLTTRGKRDRSETKIQFDVELNEKGWVTSYSSKGEKGETRIAIEHQGTESIRFHLKQPGEESPKDLSFAQSHQPFAGSAFWISDLAYPKCSFFLWPSQKLLKKEIRRGQSCFVLESIHPSPTPGEYAKAVSWIDEDTLGPVEIHTYDTDDKRWKEFRPKSFKKVNGRYEVEELEIRDRKEDIRSTIEFDL